jgi:hypothetical protein
LQNRPNDRTERAQYEKIAQDFKKLTGQYAEIMDEISKKEAELNAIIEDTIHDEQYLKTGVATPRENDADATRKSFLHL